MFNICDRSKGDPGAQGAAGGAETLATRAFQAAQ